ncbi:MAG TPA: septum formation initiator [Bacteroidales bacterium]|nr:septum formation initiator [Bacteroidales bacterium]
MKEKMQALWNFIKSGFVWLISKHRLLYIIACILLILVLFFDDDSLLNQFRLQQKINKTEKEIEHYQKKIDTYQGQINHLRSSDDALEQYAREKYLMKAPNEDVYIVEEED